MNKNSIIKMNEMNKKLEGYPYGIVGFVGGEYKSHCRCLMICHQHLGDEDCSLWGNPWQPIHTDLFGNGKVKHGCPKCKKSYVRTEAEAVREANINLAKHNRNIRALGVIGNYLDKKTKSRVSLECCIHGLLN